MLFPKKLYLLAFVSLLLRIFIACFLELGNDEVYYVKYIEFLDFAYFDHPALFAWLGNISTLSLHYNSEFFIRLFPLIFGFLNTFVIYKITEKISNANAAFFSSILYNASIYASIISGIFFMPDFALSFFALCFLYFSLQSIIQNQPKILLLSSIFLALALASKYQAAMFGFGLMIFILWKRKNWLRSKYIYIAFIIIFLGIIPTLYWNFQNDFISFRFHSGRIEKSFEIDNILRELFGQIFYNNPISWFLYIVLFIKIFREKLWKNDVVIFLLLCSLPLIFIAFYLSFSTETFPHWSGISYYSLMILTSIYLPKKYQKIPFFALIFTFFVMIVGFFEIQNGFFMNTKIKTQSVQKKGKHDFTQDTFGWEQLGEKFAKIKSKYPEISLIASHRWYPGSHLDFYVAKPNHLKTIVIGDTAALHQYIFIQKNLHWKSNEKAFYITSSNHYVSPNFLVQEFQVKPLDTIAIIRKNDTIRLHFVYKIIHR